MKHRGLFIAGVPAFCIVALTYTVCGWPYPKFTVVEQADGVRSSMLRFASWRSERDPSAEYYGFSYRFRLQGNEIFVRGTQYRDADTVETYAISTMEPFQVRGVPRAIWDAAKPIDEVSGENTSRSVSVSYEGKQYTGVGEQWEDAEISPGGRWLFLQTYDDKDLFRVEDDFFFGGPQARIGPTYVELYDVATAERVFFARSRSHDQIVYNNPQWANESDRYLFLPISDVGIRGQTCLLVVLPEAKEKGQ